MAKKIQTSLLIRGLELPIHLGWTEEERLEAQIILLRVKIKFLTVPIACQTDELTDTICYASLIEKIKQHVLKKSYRLVEHLAQDIFGLIKDNVTETIRLTIRVTKHPKIAGLSGDINFTYQEAGIT